MPDKLLTDQYGTRYRVSGRMPYSELTPGTFFLMAGDPPTICECKPSTNPKVSEFRRQMPATYAAIVNQIVIVLTPEEEQCPTS